VGFSFADASSKASETAKSAKDSTVETADSATEKVKDTAADAADKTEGALDASKEKVKSAKHEEL